MKIGKSADVNEILKVNPKFEQIIPPLTADEFAQLEENILKVGRVIEPIQVWNGFIVDGHHRYKIVQKHPEITYTTCEREFESEIEAVDWICGYQLGRRNLNDIARKVLTAQKYQAIKQMGKFHGNQHTLPKKSGLVDNQPDHNAHGTRSVLANELGVTNDYIWRSLAVSNGLEAAEELKPGVKADILSGKIKPTEKEVANIAKLPLNERKSAVECLGISKEERKAKEIARQIEEAFANGTEPETKEEEAQEKEELQEKEKVAPAPASIQISEHSESDKEDSKAKEHEIEESILNSMIGAVNMFIDSINNYLSRFPRLRTDPKYRSQTREIMVAARDYINDVEGDLL